MSCDGLGTLGLCHGIQLSSFLWQGNLMLAGKDNFILGIYKFLKSKVCVWDQRTPFFSIIFCTILDLNGANLLYTCFASADTDHSGSAGRRDQSSLLD